MKIYESYTNNELVLKLKQFELEHEKIKLEITNKISELDLVETEYEAASKELNKRLGTINV